MPKIHKGMTEEAYQQAVISIFIEVDTNHDDVLQLDEFKDFCIKMSEATGDKVTDFEQLKTKPPIHWQALFNLIDTDHSGTVDWQEIWKEVQN